MGTTPLKAKLLQKLTEMREEFIYEVFLDLKKAYDALYWEICLEILLAYGVGPQIEQILRKD